MKNIIFVLACMISLQGIAQKRSNVFATLDIVRQSGASLFYNQKLKDSKFGLGVGMQIPNFKISNSYSPMAEVRYFFPVERSAFIPSIQVGKNFSRFVVADNSGALSGKNQGRGGLQLNANIGFSLGMLKNHDGPYASVGVRYINYRYFSEGIKYDSKTIKDLVVSVGFRF